MRVILVSIGSLIVALICFWIVKLWGQSQIYHDYQHPIYTSSPDSIQFIKPSFKNLESALKNQKFLYLDMAITQDQRIVLPKRSWKVQERPIGYSFFPDIKNDVLLLDDYKPILKDKIIIFNMIENTQAAHEIFFYNMKQLGLERGENFIVTSPFEAPIKALKELAPSFLYGTTKPEILKILAMSSMHLLEAANIRADLIIHPIKIRNQTFLTEEMLSEFSRRHKRVIIGPINESEKEQAMKFKPYGLIIDEN